MFTTTTNSTQPLKPTTTYFVSQQLNPSNYIKWRGQAETQIAIQGLSNHIIFDSFDLAYASYNVKTEREQRYDRLVKVIRDKKLDQPAEDAVIEELQLKYPDVSTWESTKAKALIQWNIDEEKLIGTLRGIVESHYWTNIKNIKSAKLIWIQLKKETQQDEAGNLMALLNMFFNMKYSDGEPLSQFIARAQAIVDQVQDLGKTFLTPEVVCYRVLSALPPRFDALQQAIFQLPIKSITLDTLKSRFSAEDSRSGATHLIRNSPQQLPFVGSIVGRKCIDCQAALEPTQKDFHRRCINCQKQKKKEPKPSEKYQKASSILIL